MPSFVVGYLLVWFFSIYLGWLPAQGYVSLFADPAKWLLHLVAPTLAMSTVLIVLIARITRASVIETLGQDYVRTARALGAGETRVFALYALRNAAVPIVTVIAIGIGIVLTGVVVTETVFNLPSMGRLQERAGRAPSVKNTAPGRFEARDLIAQRCKLWNLSGLARRLDPHAVANIHISREPCAEQHRHRRRSLTAHVEREQSCTGDCRFVEAIATQLCRFE